MGAGNVGATVAQEIARRDYAEVVLVDIKEGLPQGKALDIDQAAAVLGYEPSVLGTNGYDETAGSEVVVVTAGVPRTGDMSRDDLVTTNEKIVGSVAEAAAAQSPDAILIVVSNPLDAMCHVARNVTGWPKERVFGMAGILDTARFSTFIAWETGASIKDVTAMVLGGHGDQMVPVVSATTVGGVPLAQLVSEDRIEAMVERTRKGGGELVKLLGTSAWYAPGAAVAQMVDAIMLDQKRVLPCTAFLEGEYGIDGLYIGIPVKLGAGGVEQIVELDLSAAEQRELAGSADAVREVVESTHGLTAARSAAPGYDRSVPRPLRGWRLPVVVLAAVAAVAGALYVIPSDHYLVLPDRARPADPLVSVPGEKKGEERGGIYMVDVLVRKASVLERIFPGIEEGSSLVPAKQVNPVGVSDEQRRQSSLNEMSRSQQIAAAVALRSLGRRVRIKPNGVEVTLDQAGLPEPRESSKIGDVIVRADGSETRTRETLLRVSRRVTSNRGALARLVVNRGDGRKAVTVGTKADPEDPKRAVFGVQIEQSADIELPVAVKIEAGNIGGPSAGSRFSRSTSWTSSGVISDHGKTVVATGCDLTRRKGGPDRHPWHKIIGARQAGADLFLVPDENAAEARRYADGIHRGRLELQRSVASILSNESVACFTTLSLPFLKIPANWVFSVLATLPKRASEH